MSITGLLEQAKLLSPEERDELIQELMSMQTDKESDSDDISAHWGQSLNQLLEKIEPLDMKYTEIEDPVEWVKTPRQKRQDFLKSFWEDDE